VSHENVPSPVGWLPRWARSPYALTIVSLLVVVPVAVSLLRSSHFDTTLEVFPTLPPGNAAAASGDGPAVRELLANPGFETGAKGWKDHPSFALRHSRGEAHSGTGSLACVRNRRNSLAGRAASTKVVLPAPGRYRVQARVRLSRGYSGGPPQLRLEGFARSGRAAERPGDPRARERWQAISSDYVVAPSDLEGRIVLRAGRPLPQRGQVLHLDDVRVLSNDDRLPAPSRVNLIANPGFEYDRAGWGDPPGFTVRRSDTVAHAGTGSLRSSSDEPAPRDTNAGYTYLRLPRRATYRVGAWVYLPRKRNVRAGQPAVYLEGFAGSTLLGQTLGDRSRLSRWQRVSTDYAISGQDLEGSVVLRDVPSVTPRGRPRGDAGGGPVVFWDDVSVAAPRPRPPRDARGQANSLRAALEEPQLRFEVALTARDNDIYDPGRATVLRSSRKDALSFIVTVASDVPSDARDLARPLRSALVRAARRSTLRRAQQTAQRLTAKLGSGLRPRQRALLQRRSNVLQQLIGAQAADVVALPESVPEPSVAARTAQQRAQKRMQRRAQKIISRLGNDLPPRRRALAQQRADDLQRMVGAQAAEFVVLPSGSVAKPSRPLDRLLDWIPGPFPARVGPLSAAAAGLICALLLLGVLSAVTAVRHGGHAAQGR